MFMLDLIAKCDHEGCSATLTMRVPVTLFVRFGPHACKNVFAVAVDARDEALREGEWRWGWVGMGGDERVLCPTHKPGA